MAKERTALLLRCSEEEAKAIREGAHRERRTISGFILNSVLNRIANQKKLAAAWRDGQGQRKVLRSEALDEALE